MIPVQRVVVKGTVQQSTQKLRVPLCKDCRFLKDDTCVKYMYLNLVTGDETHVMAIDARNRFDMCGVGGSHYQPISGSIERVDGDLSC